MAISRARTWQIGWLIFIVPTVCIVILARYRVDIEVSAYRQQMLQNLETRVRSGDESLRREMDAILDRLVQVTTPDELRSLQQNRELARGLFRVEGEAITWPLAVRPSEVLAWHDSADEPVERRLLHDAYSYLSRGDLASAKTAFGACVRSATSFAVRAEAELQLAQILARGDRNLSEAVEHCQRILDAAKDGEFDVEPNAQQWLLAARYQRAVFEERAGNFGESRSELLGLMRHLTEAADALEPQSPGGEFYLAMALDRLRQLETRETETGEGAEDAPGDAAPDDVVPDDDVSDDDAAQGLMRLAEIQLEERRFRSRLEALYLPVLQALAEDSAPQFVFFPGDDQHGEVLCVRKTGEQLSGVLSNGDQFLERWNDFLWRPGVEGLTAANFCIVDSKGRLLSGQRNAVDPESPDSPLFHVALRELPWTVEWDAAAHEAEFRKGRYIFYGSLVALASILIGLTSLSFARSTSRQLELAELKSQFVANVSHELKTPLTLIRMFTDMLLLGYSKDAEETERNLRIIARESETLSLLIDNVLEISRIEAGQKMYSPRIVDLVGLTREIVADYRPYALQKGFEVVLSEPSERVEVSIDRLAYTQALRNLLSNAVKFSPREKEIDIDIDIRDDQICVEVKDRGVGLLASDCQRIFERFYRTERGAEDQISGSGIGLAVVQHIVASHGGRIEAFPRDGGGSRFAMQFPRTRSEEVGV